jgi:hypothetical protein
MPVAEVYSTSLIIVIWTDLKQYTYIFWVLDMAHCESFKKLPHLTLYCTFSESYLTPYSNEDITEIENDHQ